MNVLLCESSTKIKFVILVKNGMAHKAFKKYCKAGDVKNIGRQITKGSVKLLAP